MVVAVERWGISVSSHKLPSSFSMDVVFKSMRSCARMFIIARELIWLCHTSSMSKMNHMKGFMACKPKKEAKSNSRGVIGGLRHMICLSSSHSYPILDVYSHVILLFQIKLGIVELMLSQNVDIDNMQHKKELVTRAGLLRSAIFQNASFLCNLSSIKSRSSLFGLSC